jgi:hypothetical protein
MFKNVLRYDTIMITLICIILVVRSQTKLLRTFKYMGKELLLYYSMSGLTVTECVETCEFIWTVYIRGKKIVWFILWPVYIVIYKKDLA